jgi:hypothetical protein
MIRICHVEAKIGVEVTVMREFFTLDPHTLKSVLGDVVNILLVVSHRPRTVLVRDCALNIVWVARIHADFKAEVLLKKTDLLTKTDLFALTLVVFLWFSFNKALKEVVNLHLVSSLCPVIEFIFTSFPVVLVIHQGLAIFVCAIEVLKCAPNFFKVARIPANTEVLNSRGADILA